MIRLLLLADVAVPGRDEPGTPLKVYRARSCRRSLRRCRRRTYRGNRHNRGSRSSHCAIALLDGKIGGAVMPSPQGRKLAEIGNGDAFNPFISDPPSSPEPHMYRTDFSMAPRLRLYVRITVADVAFRVMAHRPSRPGQSKTPEVSCRGPVIDRISVEEMRSEVAADADVHRRRCPVL